MTYIDIDGKWHIYQMDAARAESTACGITEWDYNPDYSTHEPTENKCRKCFPSPKAAKSDGAEA